MQVTQASDVEAFYRESGERLWWSVLAYAGSPEIASDAVSEAFARALNTTETIRDPAAWVWKVAFRIATTELRSSRQRVPITEAAYEMDERSIGVVTALAKLSRNQRAVTVLFYLDDRSTAEIASVLGMAPATVYVHLHRARNRLRSILGDDDA